LRLSVCAHAQPAGRAASPAAPRRATQHTQLRADARRIGPERAAALTQVGDARTAADARMFLVNFLQRFPAFAGSALYLAGESYAGHYIPTLAAAILDGNAAAAAPGASAEAAAGHLNLKGILVGNAWTDAPTDNYGAAFHWCAAGAAGQLGVCIFCDL
jgi:hypothetical protein